MATVHCGSKLWVTLNSSHVANILYNRKGLITNGRPSYPVVGDLISLGQRTLFMPTNQWSDKRRVMHQLLTGTAIAKYEDYQELESVQMPAEYLLNPNNGTNTILDMQIVSYIASHSVRELRGNTGPTKACSKAQKAFIANLPPTLSAVSQSLQIFLISYNGGAESTQLFEY